MDRDWEDTSEGMEFLETSINEQIEYERKQADEEREKAEDDRRELFAKIDDVHAEKEEILQELSGISEQKVSLALDNKHLKDRLEAERDKVAKLEASLKKNAQVLTSKQEEVNEAKQAQQEAKRPNNNLRKDLDARIAELADKDVQLEAKDEEIREQKGLVSEKHIELVEAHRNLGSLQTEIATLNGRSREQETTCENLKAEKHTLQANILELKSELEYAKKRLFGLEPEVEMLRGEQASLTTQLLDRQAELNTARANLSYLQSHSGSSATAGDVTGKRLETANNEIERLRKELQASHDLERGLNEKVAADDVKLCQFLDTIDACREECRELRNERDDFKNKLHQTRGELSTCQLRLVQEGEQLRRTRLELDDSKTELEAERRELKTISTELDNARAEAWDDQKSLHDSQGQVEKLQYEKTVVDRLRAQAEQEHQETANQARQWQSIVYCGDNILTTFDLSAVSALLKQPLMLYGDATRRAATKWLSEVIDTINPGACLNHAASVACGLFQTAVLEPSRLNHTTISTFVRSYAADTSNDFSQPLVFLEAAILVLAHSDQANFSEAQSTFAFRTVEFLCWAFNAGDRLDGLKRSFEALRPRLQDSSPLNQALADHLEMGFMVGFASSQALAQDVWHYCKSHPHWDIRPHTRIATFGDATYVVHCDFLCELDTKERVEIFPKSALGLRLVNLKPNLMVRGYPKLGEEIVEDVGSKLKKITNVFPWIEILDQ
ncbi:hypothetical protein LTR92_008105 [Exophiala xenobiotica]|nr:hypothetical protein LTR92_008105 [Exophiala xenobiotica]